MNKLIKQSLKDLENLSSQFQNTEDYDNSATAEDEFDQAYFKIFDNLEFIQYALENTHEVEITLIDNCIYDPDCALVILVNHPNFAKVKPETLISFIFHYWDSFENNSNEFYTEKAIKVLSQLPQQAILETVATQVPLYNNHATLIRTLEPENAVRLLTRYTRPMLNNNPLFSGLLTDLSIIQEALFENDPTFNIQTLITEHTAFEWLNEMKNANQRSPFTNYLRALCYTTILDNDELMPATAALPDFIDELKTCIEVYDSQCTQGSAMDYIGGKAGGMNACFKALESRIIAFHKKVANDIDCQRHTGNTLSL